MCQQCTLSLSLLINSLVFRVNEEKISSCFTIFFGLICKPSNVALRNLVGHFKRFIISIIFASIEQVEFVKQIG